jgi:hypothetical protein
MENLNDLYDSAVAEYGQEAADMVAQESVEAFNSAAIAGMTEEQCEAEQSAAFSAALTGYAGTEWHNPVRVVVDYENNAEEFWDHIRSCEDAPAELVGMATTVEDEILVSPQRGRELIEWCVSAPGWRDGPDYAPTALIFD